MDSPEQNTCCNKLQSCVGRDFGFTPNSIPHSVSDLLAPFSSNAFYQYKKQNEPWSSTFMHLYIPATPIADIFRGWVQIMLQREPCPLVMA